MKTGTKILLIIFIACLLGMLSCRKTDTYPVIPAIAFVDFTKISDAQGIDQKGTLQFSFTDGDGDIGLSAGDTLPPFNKGSQYYYDLIITYYEKQNGNYVAVTLPFPNSARIPVITPEGKNKSIKGTIQVDLFINNPFSAYDTIAFDAYIYDRALNKSNTIRTPDIIVKKI